MIGRGKYRLETMNRFMCQQTNRNRFNGIENEQIMAVASLGKVVCSAVLLQSCSRRRKSAAIIGECSR